MKAISLAPTCGTADRAIERHPSRERSLNGRPMTRAGLPERLNQRISTQVWPARHGPLHLHDFARSALEGRAARAVLGAAWSRCPAEAQPAELADQILDRCVVPGRASRCRSEDPFRPRFAGWVPSRPLRGPERIYRPRQAYAHLAESAPRTGWVPRRTDLRPVPPVWNRGDGWSVVSLHSLPPGPGPGETLGADRAIRPSEPARDRY